MSDTNCQMSEAFDAPSSEGSEIRGSHTVFLVHGTWARGRNRQPLGWQERGSDFRGGLEEALSDQVRLEAHEWSGRNRAGDRALAAHELRERIERALTRHERGTVSVIGHSHGGSVAVDAVAELDPVLRCRTRVLTLATPFLWIRARELSVLERAFFYGARHVPEIAFSLLTVAILFGVPSGLMWLLAPELWESGSAWSNVAMLPLTLVLFWLWFRLVRSGWPTRRFRRFRDHLRSLLDREVSRTATDLDLLCLRAPGDEATLAITVAEALAELNRLLLKTISALPNLIERGVNAMVDWWDAGYARARWRRQIWRVLAFSFLGLILATLAAVFLWEERISDEVWAIWSFVLLGPPAMAILVFGAYALIAAVAFFPVFLVSAALLLPYGLDLALLGPWTVARVGSVPVGGPWTVELVPTDREGSGVLRHAMYADPMVQDRVVSWVRGHEKLS